MMRIAHHLHVTGELSLSILMHDQKGVNCSSYLVLMDYKHLEGTILAADVLTCFSRCCGWWGRP